MALYVGIQLAAISSYVGAQPATRPAGTYRPFTAQIKTTYFDEQGGATAFVGAFYRRSDGSSARIQEAEGPGNARGLVIDIVDYPNRIWIGVEPFLKTVTVVARNERGFNALQTVLSGNCENFRERAATGESRRFAVRAVEFEDRWSAKLTHRIVVAPELACYPLLDLLFERGVFVTKTEVLSLQFGEPDASAFQVPPGYKQVSPLELENLWRAKYNQPHLGDKLAGQLEQEYEEGRARLVGRADK